MLKKEEALLLGLGGLGLLALLTRKPPPPGGAEFAGFRTELRQTPTQTTTRQRDGAQAYDFWHYPLVAVTADVTGNFTVVWRYVNSVDGAPTYDSGDVTNGFALAGGQTQTLELRDTRAAADPARGESIAYGDPEGLFDGAWHTFRSEVAVTVVSPSGTQASAAGVLEEVFRSVGLLSVSFAGFSVIQV